MKSVTPNEKTSKIDLFLTPVTLTLGQGHMPTMPGYQVYQDTSTIAISSRSNNGKVLKSCHTPNRQTYRYLDHKMLVVLKMQDFILMSAEVPIAPRMVKLYQKLHSNTLYRNPEGFFDISIAKKMTGSLKPLKSGKNG